MNKKHYGLKKEIVYFSKSIGNSLIKKEPKMILHH